jgi:2,3-bisphosphoglycerate-independent phosphoglycerate mutase
MVFDKIYNEWAVFFKFGYSVSYKFIDRGIFEILGNGLSLVSLNIASRCNQVLYYTLVILMGGAY